jgi:hypothetical protein
MQPAALAIVRLQRTAATPPRIEPVRFGVPFTPAYAAQYGPPEQRDAFLSHAALFFEASVVGVMAFATRACTRPLAVLLSNCLQRTAVRLHPPAPFHADGLDDCARDPSAFRSQRDRVRAQLATPAGWLRVLRAGMRPSVLWRVATGKIW